MPDQQVRFLQEDSDQPLVPRALPNAQFVQDLDNEIRRAARQKMEAAGIYPTVPFQEMVIELRKLVRLLRKTLIPVYPRAEFSRALAQQAQAWAAVEISEHQQQRRLWVVGGMVGSALSVAGVMTALLLRRRNDNDNGSDPPHTR